MKPVHNYKAALDFELEMLGNASTISKIQEARMHALRIAIAVSEPSDKTISIASMSTEESVTRADIRGIILSLIEAVE